jgi:hypothetical protein
MIRLHNRLHDGELAILQPIVQHSHEKSLILPGNQGRILSFATSDKRGGILLLAPQPLAFPVSHYPQRSVPCSPLFADRPIVVHVALSLRGTRTTILRSKTRKSIDNVCGF